MKTIKEILNENIANIIFTQFKKDAKESHKLVSDYGYEIYKYGNGYRVWNPKTHKAVDGNVKYSWRTENKDYRIEYGYRYKIFKDCKDYSEIKFDFVNYLNKDINNVWYELIEKKMSKAKSSYERIKNYEWWLETENKRIKETKVKIDEKINEIKSLEGQLIYYAKEVTRYEYELKEYRKKIGIKDKT